MIIEQNENIVIVTQEKASVIELVRKLQTLYPKYENNNIIITLTSLNKLTDFELAEFLQLAKKHKKAKHSFVLVSSKVDLDDVPDTLILVPTLKEAHDIIEMEDMERDLGL